MKGGRIIPLAALAAACTEPTVPPVGGVIAGCVAVLPGPECTYVRGSTITVWAAAPTAGARLSIDGELHDSRGQAAGDGVRFETVLDGEHRSIAVSGAGRFEVRLSPLESVSPADPIARAAFTLHQDGRRALANGDVDQAYRLLARAASEGRRAEDAHLEREASLLLSYIDIQILGRFPEAQARLDSIPPPTAEDGRARAAMALFRGQLASRLLDWSTAERQLIEAATIAGWSFGQFGPGAQSDRALLYLNAGDFRGAHSIWNALLRSDLDPCSRSVASANAGWANALEGVRLDEAERLLRNALDGFTSSCPRAFDADTQRINLAWLAIERRDPSDARRWLETVKSPSPQLAGWVLAVDARAKQLEARYSEASEAYAALDSLATRMRDTGLAWMARVGRARVALATGASESAVRLLEAAEELLSADHARVPLTRGHFGLLMRRADSGHLLVETLARLGRTEEALRVLDRIRARARWPLRFHSAVDRLDGAARHDWAEAVGEYDRARAALREHLTAGWSSQDGAERRAAREAELSRAVDAALDRVAALIGSPEHAPGGPLAPPPGIATVAPVGELLFVIHSTGTTILSGRTVVEWWRGTPRAMRPTALVRLVSDDPELAVALLSESELKVPVVLADSVALAPTRVDDARRGTLVIADPRRDLVDARREGSEIREITDGVLLLGADATQAAVERALPSTSLLHFAGHGRWDGPFGWRSALLLADGPLVVSDILLMRAPPIVVLSGCTTALDSERYVAPGTSVARAFLDAGAHAVVATHRAVESRIARRFASHLYRDDPKLVSPARAYLAALRGLEKEGLAWQPFVLLER